MANRQTNKGETSITLAIVMSTIILVPLFYLGSMITLESYSLYTSEKIKDKKQLGMMLKEESDKLGLDNTKIHARLGGAEGLVAMYKKLSDGEFEIILDGLGQNRGALKHELYHIKNYPENSIIGETKCTLYSSLGIKF